MIYEIAEIDVNAGQEADFEAGVRQAVPLIQSAEGCHGLELQRSIEIPGRYRLFVTWESLDRHIDFRNSPAFGEWRKLVGAFFASPPRVEHSETIFRGF